MIEPNLRGNGKVALVTGAARGIGLGISAWLIAEGWQVVLADNDRERGARVAEALGEHAWFVAMDVAQEGQVAMSVAEVLGQFGRLDGQAAPLTELDHDQHLVGRVGTVEDVASLVAWLLSEDAGFVTGQEFLVDGGMTRKMVYLD